MTSQDTIAAIATAPGQGGVGIVRISGPEAEQVLSRVFRPAKAAPLVSHMLTYGHVMDGGETVDECMAVLMRAPPQLHPGGCGGIAAPRRLLSVPAGAGAVPAKRCAPG